MQLKQENIIKAFIQKNYILNRNQLYQINCCLYILGVLSILVVLFKASVDLIFYIFIKKLYCFLEALLSIPNHTVVNKSLGQMVKKQTIVQKYSPQEIKVHATKIKLIQKKRPNKYNTIHWKQYKASQDGEKGKCLQYKIRKVQNKSQNKYDKMRGPIQEIFKDIRQLPIQHGLILRIRTASFKQIKVTQQTGVLIDEPSNKAIKMDYIISRLKPQDKLSVQISMREFMLKKFLKQIDCEKINQQLCTEIAYIVILLRAIIYFFSSPMKFETKLHDLNGSVGGLDGLGGLDVFDGINDLDDLYYCYSKAQHSYLEFQKNKTKDCSDIDRRNKIYTEIKQIMKDFNEIFTQPSCFSKLNQSKESKKNYLDLSEYLGPPQLLDYQNKARNFINKKVNAEQVTHFRKYLKQILSSVFLYQDVMKQPKNRNQNPLISSQQLQKLPDSSRKQREISSSRQNQQSIIQSQNCVTDLDKSIDMSLGMDLSFQFLSDSNKQLL